MTITMPSTKHTGTHGTEGSLRGWELPISLPFSYDGTFSCSNLLSCTVFRCKNLSCSLTGFPSTTGNKRLPTLSLGIGKPSPIASVAAKSVCWTRFGCRMSPREERTFYVTGRWYVFILEFGLLQITHLFKTFIIDSHRNHILALCVKKFTE